MVDQFGYRPELAKVAVLVDPVLGWNAKEGYEPGQKLEVRRTSDGRVVFSGAPKAWNNGAVDAEAGDRGWWFDFSALKEPGSYVVHDPARNVSSARFEIRSDVYRDVLRAAERAFYYNRANLQKRAPFACVKQKCWTLGADNVGPRQDREARSVDARDDPKTARDLSGGWWDAGDTDKYVTFAQAAVHQLLSAYSEHPAPFTDDFGIPESGNGLPDLIDELKVELDWLQKMQPADLEGGALIKLGNVQDGEPIPDQSRLPRYYYPKPCSSATIALSSMFAHAALVFEAFPPLKAYAAELLSRAARAWDHYQSHPRSDACDDGRIKAGDADRELSVQDQTAVVAAVYLFAATKDARYGDFVKRDYRLTRPFDEDRWSVYDPDQGDALLYYASLKSADAEVKKAILDRKRSQAGSVEIYGFRPELALYRAYMRKDSFHWGSNMSRANYGNTNFDLILMKLVEAEREAEIRERAASILHHFHGVNAMGLVYLSNMELYGAEHSVSEIFHGWFRDGDTTFDSSKTSKLGPAPGFLAGGPNLHYCEDQNPAEHRCARSELRRQPPEKAYLDFNTGYRPESEYDQSWEITEPGIYYQAAYLKLLSKFVD